MHIMGRRVLRLAGIGIIAIAIPQLATTEQAIAEQALASDSGNGAAFKLAMGPTSAALKNQGTTTTSDNTVANCSLSEGTCAKPHHRHKSKRSISAAQSR
jgi:hypothetical protein